MLVSFLFPASFWVSFQCPAEVETASLAVDGRTEFHAAQGLGRPCLGNWRLEGCDFLDDSLSPTPQKTWLIFLEILGNMFQLEEFWRLGDVSKMMNDFSHNFDFPSLVLFLQRRICHVCWLFGKTRCWPTRVRHKGLQNQVVVGLDEGYWSNSTVAREDPSS